MVRALRLLAATALLTVASLALGGAGVEAHAELESASPAPNSTAAGAPRTLMLIFTEEVQPESVRVSVTTPDGREAVSGPPAVDLNDPARRTVTVPLRAQLPRGVYTVRWSVTSGLDAHTEEGTFSFSISASDAATPVASPVASPAVRDDTPTAVAAAATDPEPTVRPADNGNPLAADADAFDSRAFGISVAVGLVAAVLIYLFWRAVRPKDPRFGGRASRQ